MEIMEIEKIIERFGEFNNEEKQSYGTQFVDNLLKIYREDILSSNSVILITTREENEIFALIASYMFTKHTNPQAINYNKLNIFQGIIAGCDFLNLVDKKIYHLKDLLPPVS